MLFSAGLMALGASLVAAVPSIKVQGSDFINEKTGEKFQIIGMGYQPGGESAFSPTSGDPLSDPEACKRDAALMQILGINAVRVYNLQPDLNHDECASIFNAAGMYLMIDVNSPLVGQSLTSYEPWTSYYAGYLNHTFAVVEAFSNYPNTLLFFSANELINNVASAQYAPQYMRSVTRDLKNYIKNNIERDIPVGYSAADVRPILEDTLNYMSCNEDGNDSDDSTSDFFSLNSYSWCGIDATFSSSTYEALEDMFQNITLPIFFSEYGCIKGGRYWNDTQAIYGTDMDGTLSGAVAYQWTQESDGYGIVSVNGSTTYLLNQYALLKEKFGLIDWNTVEALSPAKSTPSPVTCSSKLIQESGFDSNFTLIPPPPGAETMIKNGITNKPKGQIVSISDYTSSLKVVDTDGNTMQNLAIKVLPSDEFNWQGKNAANTGSGSSNSSSSGSSGNGTSSSGGDDDSAASGFLQPAAWAAVVPLLAMLFA